MSFGDGGGCGGGVKKMGKSTYKLASDELRTEINTEARGERIASEIIATAIRARKA